MKTILLATAIALIAGTAQAQFTQQTFGGTTFTNGPNGYNATQQTFGGTTFGNDSQGNHWTQQTFGGTTFTNGTGPAFNNRRW